MSSSGTKIRTRIAPSPTGFVHLGNAYMALFNYAFTRKNGGEFVLRLEDTDQKRHVEEAEKVLYDGLSWLGLSWDEGPDKGGEFAPYRQSERLELYKEKVKELVDKGMAYEDEGAVRFKNTNKPMAWTDLIRGEISFPGEEVTDFVILKSDGFPTYNFAVVIDDIVMKITHVIRGEEHISNTPRQLALYEAFGVEPPKFAHLPTLRNAQTRKKLSKRTDPVDLRLYRDAGYLPEALLNLLSLLGWSHPEEKEVFSLNEFIENFSLERVDSAGPIFDVKKLDWINGVYIREKTNEELFTLLRPFVSKEADDNLLGQLIPLIKERIFKLSDVDSLASFLWQNPEEKLNKELFQDDQTPSYLDAALEAMGSLKNWELEELNRSLTESIEKGNFKTGNFYMALRLALAGQKVTPPINESMILLGKDEVLRRIKKAQEVLK